MTGLDGSTASTATRCPNWRNWRTRTPTRVRLAGTGRAGNADDMGATQLLCQQGDQRSAGFRIALGQRKRPRQGRAFSGGDPLGQIIKRKIHKSIRCY